MFVNTSNQREWDKSGGDKKKYGRLMHKKTQELAEIQRKESISNLRGMLAKELITQEEYNDKIAKISRR